jgi:hypothetical protein
MATNHAAAWGPLTIELRRKTPAFIGFSPVRISQLPLSYPGDLRMDFRLKMARRTQRLSGEPMPADWESLTDNCRVASQFESLDWPADARAS